MFRRIIDQAPVVQLTFEDRSVLARKGDSIAAALLADGVLDFRDTPVSLSPRAPYCMMGVCFDCLVEIDGIGSRQACLTTVADGMVIRRQRGAHSVT
jgi:predicted molibdopterin-dependent oxidoreductase YjgC